MYLFLCFLAPAPWKFRFTFAREVSTHTHTHIYTHTHTHTQTYVRACFHTHTYKHTHTGTHTYILTLNDLSVLLYFFTDGKNRAHGLPWNQSPFTHTHTHTHARTLSKTLGWMVTQPLLLWVNVSVCVSLQGLDSNFRWGVSGRAIRPFRLCTSCVCARVSALVSRYRRNIYAVPLFCRSNLGMFIEGAKVNVTYSLPTTDIVVTAESGTDIIIFVDYGDNETIQKSWYASADLVQPFSNDYAPEIYQASVALCNDFNYTVLTHQICSFLPVVGTITVCDWSEFMVLV